MESDYLLGVHDEARMGALRFKTSPDGHFLNDDQAMAAPPWARLRELEEASRHVDDDSTDSEREKWLAVVGWSSPESLHFCSGWGAVDRQVPQPQGYLEHVRVGIRRHADGA